MRPTARAAGLVPAISVVLLTAGLAPPLPAVREPSVPAAPIRHVIEIMLENHTFDDLFPGHLAAGQGAQAGPGRPRVTRILAPHNEGDVQGGIDNSRAAEFKAMDYQPGKGYLMDGYTKPPFGRSAVTSFGSWADPNLQYLARRYETARQNFQPAVGPTRPNIMMALNGTAHGWYFNRRDPHPTPWYSIFDELTRYGRSWKIYLALPSGFLPHSRWRALIPHGHTADLTTANRFFTDLSTGRLPSFAFLRPGFGYSEEPREDIGEGDAWLGQVVAAVARSRYWRSTAIFVSYDEGGGFADHAAPPAASGYGTRTPLVVVSPWAHRGAFRQRSTNVSILSFMQHLWGMPPLTGLNRQQNDLAAAFDFRQPPLPRPNVPVAPHETIGFHGRTLVSKIHATYPHRWLRIYLDAETGGLSLDQAVRGRMALTVTAPAQVRRRLGFPVRTSLVRGRAMVRVRFPAAGYYRIKAAGPDGSVGWTTVVVLKPHHRAARGTSGLPRSTM